MLNELPDLLERAVGRGLRGVALVDRRGNPVELAGEMDADIAMPLAGLVLHRLKRRDLSERLFGGEILSTHLDDRDVAVAVAKRQLFVVAVVGEWTPVMETVVAELRDSVSRALADAESAGVLPPFGGGGGGSGQGPAELPVVEFGLTVPRAKA